MLTVNILIAIGYIVILVECFSIAFHGGSSIPGQALSQKFIFLGIAAILILLTISRFFNLNDYLTNETRMFALHEGWYDGRRNLQMIFVCSVFIAAILMFIFFEKKLGSIWKYYSTTFIGITFLICFIIISTASYHPVDQLLKKQLAGIRYSRILEFLIILWIAVTILLNKKRSDSETVKIQLSPKNKFL